MSGYLNLFSLKSHRDDIYRYCAYSSFAIWIIDGIYSRHFIWIQIDIKIDIYDMVSAQFSILNMNISPVLKWSAWDYLEISGIYGKIAHKGCKCKEEYITKIDSILVHRISQQANTNTMYWLTIYVIEFHLKSIHAAFTTTIYILVTKLISQGFWFSIHIIDFPIKLTLHAFIGTISVLVREVIL